LKEGSWRNNTNVEISDLICNPHLVKGSLHPVSMCLVYVLIKDNGFADDGIVIVDHVVEPLLV